MKTSWLLLLVVLISTTAWAAGPPTGPWHPEITTYPRLIFGPGDLPELQTRITRAPYTTLMQRVRNLANAGYSPTIPDPYNAGREYGNANIAKSAAFVAWIDNDSAAADKAADILEVMAVDFGSLLIPLQDDIHIAEAIMAYSQAYDILAGTGLVDQTRLDGIAALLGQLVSNLYADYFDQFAFWQAFSRNNHSTKINAALAIAAMTINQHNDANKWFNLGVTETVTKLFDYMLTPDGADGEGPYYGTYSAVQHLPMFLAYDRLVGTDETLLKRDFCLVGPNCSWSEIEVQNPLDNPALLAMSQWYVRIRMPDGGYAPIDDANIEGFFNGLLVGPWQDGLLAWDWVTNEREPLFANHCSDLNIELIAFYDDSVPLEAPDQTDFIMPGDGEAIFRSGWDAAASWMMFLAEEGQPRTSGGGHEHADNLSVSLYARGEYLLIDPGYIRWEDHQAVRLGVHHNLPTVDGGGPPAPSAITQMGGVDATLIDGLANESAPFVRGVSSYGQADIDRVVFFPEHDYLVVVDDLVADTARNFGVLWHGQAGGDSGYPFTLLDDGGRWVRNNAGVDVHVAASTGTVELDTVVNVHGFTWNVQEQHTSLDVRTATKAAHARLISVALPYSLTADETPRTITWLDRTGLAAARVESDDPLFVLAQPAATSLEFTAAETGMAEVHTNMTTLLLSTDANADAGFAYADGGHYLVLGEQRPWFIGPDRVWVDWDGDTWNFDLPANGNFVATYCRQLPNITSDGNVHWSLRGGVLRIWAHEAARVTIDF